MIKMTTTNHNNLNDIIKIPPSAKLKDEGIIEYFVKHKISNSLEIIVNHKVERNTVYVSSIDKKSLEDICKEVDKRLKEIGLDQNQRLLVKNTINNEWKLIIGLYDPCDTCEEPKNSNNNTNLIINYPNDDNEEQEKEGKIIDDESLETITPSQALRKDIAEYYKVNGTITSITKPFKMVLGIRFYCRRCKQSQEELFDLPEFDIPMFYSPTCKNCLFNGIPIVSKPPIFVNSINIEVQNSETFNDLESLPVFLFNEYTENIRVGERVEIPGVINIINTKKRHFTYFYGKSIKYLNREDYTLTKDDIRIIKRFREIHKDHIIDKLVEMFDPSIVENNLSKQGILMIAVNTSEKIGDDSEHLDGLFIGPPGLAKSKLLKRATELVPGSSNAGGQYSTGKSLTAVIDKVNDNTILRLGIIPRSRGAICAINEFGRQNPEDQDKMLDVMQERGFNFSKYGMSTYIPAPTTILASANPINNDKWLDDDKIDLDQFPFLAPIIDRFDLIFPFTYKKSKKDNDDFIDKLAEIEAKKAKKQLPNYTQFLVKYIQYSKQINPVLTDEARSRLTEFSKGVLDKGFGSPRVIITLPKLVKAIARLKLKNVADEEDAKEVMEFYNAILVKFQKTVVIPQNPKDMAYWKGVEIVKRFRKFGGIRFEELIETLCKENRQLAIHFGYGERSLKMRHNSKVREVYGLLKNHSHIIIKDEKPVVLKWLACDTCDICDKDKISKNIQNEEKNNDEKTVENELEPRSHRSHISHISSNEEEQEDKEHEYGIKFGTDYKLPIHKVTEEQFRDLNENSRHNEGDSY
jgi:DNA replicative helicase MCM subunit Mcm2 (Cdc46/Mcm family)